MKFASIQTALTLGAFLALGTATFTQADTTATAPIDFKKTVLPILQNSCFACHVSGATTITLTDPILIKKANKEIADALDFAMGTSFPFPNDDPAAKQIKHLEKTLTKGYMPPKSQVTLGLGAPLSDKDRKTLLAWVAQLKAQQ